MPPSEQQSGEDEQPTCEIEGCDRDATTTRMVEQAALFTDKEAKYIDVCDPCYKAFNRGTMAPNQPENRMLK